ncbi:MAG: hypothetical protein HY816_13840 [Candidatus Wallbacteria bacterium]|nr:hypothetical protein [Candidatus Wallbacteria bacterium]
MSSRGRRGNLAVVLVLVTVAVLLGITFLGRAGAERQLTAQLLAHQRAVAVSAAAEAEAFLHVQKTMNSPGEVWFDAFRAPPAAPAAVQKFGAPRAGRLLEEMAGRDARLEVELKLYGAVPMTGPAIDAAEKTAWLEASTRVTIGSVVRSHRVLREVRVARTAPPAPLDAFTLWLHSGPSAGALRVPAGLPGSSITGLPAAAKRAIEQDWSYSWGGPRGRFPFSRGRVSEYHDSWKSFHRRHGGPGANIRLDGVTVVADPAGGTLERGTLSGSGALWVTDGDLRLDAVAVAPNARPVLAVLAPGKRLELSSCPAGSVHRGTLWVPEGTLVTEPGLTLEGTVIADRWSIPPSTTLRPAPTPAPPCLATLSEATYEQ